MIINSDSERDYVVTYSCRASSGPNNSIIELNELSVSLIRSAIISWRIYGYASAATY